MTENASFDRSVRMANRMVARRVPIALVVAATCQLLVASIASAQPAVAGGSGFSLILKDDGTVWAAGYNSWGQLGNETRTNLELPVQVVGLSNVTSIAAGGTHSMALTSGGRVYLWGWNANGQLGDASMNYLETTPKLLSLTNVTAVAAGLYHSVALTNTGDLYTWGSNGFGELGNATNTASAVPQLVATGVQAIGTGIQFTLFVKTDGTVWGMGDNEWGQLGDLTRINRNTPVQMSGVAGAAAVRGGNKHSVILLADGTVAAVGVNGLGQSGFSGHWFRVTAEPVSGLTNIVAITAGRDFNLALDEDGAVWSWGTNDGASGTLGTPTPPWRSAPAAIPALSNIIRVAAGDVHALAIDNTNVVFVWGANSNGELGDGSFSPRTPPVATTGPSFDWRVGTPRLSIASGSYFVDQTVIVTNATVGSSLHYTRDGSDPTEFDPTVSSGAAVSITSSQTLKVKAFKSGSPESAVASATYELKVTAPAFTPAPNTYTSAQNVAITSSTPGATIRYTLDGSEPTASSTFYSGLVLVPRTSTLKAIALKAGWTTSAVQSGVYTMNLGTLAAPTMEPPTGTYSGGVTVTVAAPSAAAGFVIRYTTNGAAPSDSSAAYTGPFTVSALTTVRAKVFHADYTASAETSRTYTIAAAAPTLSAASGAYAPTSVVTVSTTEPTATLRMTLNGTDPTSSSPIIASGTSLVLGNYTLKVRAFRSGVDDSAVASASYSLTGAVGPGAIVGGGWHSVMATPDGRVFGWGDNGNGQLGDSTLSGRPTPTMLQAITGVTALAAGLGHTVALTDGGRVYTWGYNASGQLGDGTSTQRTNPTLISTIANVMAIAAGETHTLALRNDGRVLAWGGNAYGQLGLGTVSSTSTPTEIPGLTSVTAIAAGQFHSFAVTASGQLYAWGHNGSARLGDGTVSTRTTPTLINLSNVVAVAAGGSHSLGLTQDGSVYSWGLNSNGQLGHGNTTAVTIPTLIAGLQASTIAAGENHSAAIRFDGVLVAWGANSAGQLGDTFLTQRNSPVVVSGPPSVSTVSLGYAHSLVATPEGAIWSWGAGQYGRLGDNQFSNRPTPQSIMTGLANWQPAAPTISAPSTTLLEPTTVTVQSTTGGAMIRYTTNGAEPAEVDAEVPSNGSVTLSSTSQFRAKVFASGRVPGRMGRADYTMASTSPTITPSTGLYTSAQQVSITAAAGPPSTVRYTLDGSTPTTTSIVYTSAFSVTTATTVKARSFPTDGSAGSTVAVAALTFNLGPLAPPTASPDAGVYADAQSVSLSAISGATIRYTLDGTEPTSVSNLSVTPISVSGSVTIKARAFHPDWTHSPVFVADYTIDADAPSISAVQFPAAIDGWHNTPTTISFICEDNVGIASCSSSALVSSEAAGQAIVGTAIDLSGRHTTATVTVNLDSTPPAVAITTPASPLTTTDAEIYLAGTVSDALSGIAGVTCNGASANVVSGVVSCTVTLAPGRNDITLAARDAAGNVTSKGVRVTRIGTSTVLGFTPTAKTLVAQEATTLALTDEFGAMVAAATWSSSDSSIVSVSSDDPPVLTALQPGTVIITAAKNGLSAQGTLTVAAGASLPYGTTRWSTIGGPGATVGYTIAANRVDLTVPDLFSVESVGPTTIVRGVTASGDVLWTQQSPGTPIMGDSFGGLVAGTLSASPTYYDFSYSAFTRFAGPADALPWRYEAIGHLASPAQAPDGTIYVLERSVISVPSNNAPITDTKLIVLDGSTGAVRARLPIAPSRKGLSCGVNGTWEEPAIVWGPIIGDDGYGYLLVHTFTNVRSGPCPHHYAQDRALTLWRVAPTGGMTSTIILSQHCERPPGQLSTCDPGSATYVHGIVGDTSDFLPDGVGGMLVRWQRVTSVSGYPWGSPDTWTHTSEARLSRVVGGTVELDTIVDENERTQMIGRGGTAYVTSSAAWHAMDVSTWTPIWSNSNLAMEPVAALADGRIAMHDVAAGTLTEFSAAGMPLQSAAFGGGYQTALGLFARVENPFSSATLTARVSLPLDEDINSFRPGGGSASQQNGPRTAPGRTTDLDETAKLLMQFLYSAPPQVNETGQQLEHGGHICREPDAQHFYYHHLGKGTTVSAPPLILNPERCKVGTTVGYAHSHPGAFPNFAYPSGFGSQAEYDDADLNPATLDTHSDLWLADQYFDQAYGPKGPNVTWYVTSMEKPQPFVKYKKTVSVPAKDNVWRFNHVSRVWERIPAPW